MLWRREYWRFYRGPAFLAVGWFGSTSAPFTPLSRQQGCLSFAVFLCVAGRAFWRERGIGGGRRAKSFDREKAWSSVNYSILAAVLNQQQKGTIEIQNPNSQEYLRLATNTGVKGTVAWDGFFPFGHVLEGYLGSDFFWFSTKIRRDRLDFMSIGVFSMYCKILFTERSEYERVPFDRKEPFISQRTPQ